MGLDSKVVCYDQFEGNWATRAALILTAYGHGQVYVLDGGLKNWVASGKETSKDSNGTTNICENFDYTLSKDQIVTYDEVQKMIEDKTSEVVFVDARKPFLFEKGHLPNAKNLPF